MLILADLEPYRHMTRDEVINLFDKNLISRDELVLKLNFSTFVKRFERENANILEFGTQIPYTEKINKITKRFKEYASENRQRED